MTNREKYADKIREIIKNEDCFCKFITDVMLKGEEVCNRTTCGDCSKWFSFWLGEEYKEPEVAWSKVPIDAKVIITAYDGAETNRHFAGVDEKNRPTFFVNGKTSFTSNDTFAINDEDGTFVAIRLYEENENV